MFKSIFAVVVSLSLATPACASEWWYVAMGSADNNATIIFMDRESVRDTTSGVKRAWSKLFWQKPIETSHSATILSEFDCSERKERGISYTYYDLNSEVTGSSTDANPWNFVIPDTPGDEQMNFVCGTGKSDDFRQLPSNLSPQELATKVFAVEK